MRYVFVAVRQNKFVTAWNPPIIFLKAYLNLIKLLFGRTSDLKSYKRLDLWAAFLIVFIQSASASDYQATLIPDTRPAVKGAIEWQSLSVDVDSESSEIGIQSLAQVAGKFSLRESALIKDSGEVIIAPQRDVPIEFKTAIHLKGDRTEAHLKIVDFSGKVRLYKLVIMFPDWAKTKGASRFAVKSSLITPSLGVSQISLTQTNLATFSMTALAVKVAYQHQFSRKMDFGGNIFFTPISFATSRPSSKVQFLGVNARVGYISGLVEEPWRLSLQAGIYFNTMFVSGDSFGYRDVGGPQFFPVLRRLLSSGDSVQAYAKYSPIVSGVSVMSLANRELAIGGGWIHLLPNRHPLSIHADYASLNFTLSNPNREIAVSSISLSAGYGL